MTAPFAALETPLMVGLLVLVGAVIIPALFVLLPDRTRLYSLALVPLGAAMWAAHLVFHLSTGLLTVVPVMERVLKAAPDWGLSAHPLFANSLAPLQLLLLDGGLLLTLYIGWRCNAGIGKRVRSFAPWGVLATALYAAGVWILLQPMQMRGMMMMN
jgi:hypothetical protein